MRRVQAIGMVAIGYYLMQWAYGIHFDKSSGYDWHHFDFMKKMIQDFAKENQNFIGELKDAIKKRRGVNSQNHEEIEKRTSEQINIEILRILEDSVKLMSLFLLYGVIVLTKVDFLFAEKSKLTQSSGNQFQTMAMNTVNLSATQLGQRVYEIHQTAVKDVEETIGIILKDFGEHKNPRFPPPLVGRNKILNLSTQLKTFKKPYIQETTNQIVEVLKQELRDVRSEILTPQNDQQNLNNASGQNIDFNRQNVSEGKRTDEEVSGFASGSRYNEIKAQGIDFEPSPTNNNYEYFPNVSFPAISTEGVNMTFSECQQQLAQLLSNFMSVEDVKDIVRGELDDFQYGEFTANEKVTSHMISLYNHMVTLKEAQYS